MRIIHLRYPVQHPIEALPAKHVMAIGDFDGMHKGHQKVVHHAKSIANKKNVPLSIMTFNPHPREVLGQARYSQYLAPYQKKMRLFEDHGVEFCFLVHFDLEFAKVSPQEFVQRMLLTLGIDTVVVGFDFTFGHQGLGTVETLKELTAGKMAVEVVPPFHLGGQKVSSTIIREQLHLGQLEDVYHFLGRNYLISGHVIVGEKRGSSIGFPTANIQVDAPYVIPGYGVYAVKVYIGGEAYQSVMNIGVKPTFHKDLRHFTLEAHILQFDQNIYGEAVKIEFISFIREERKFASVDLLVKQIHQDIKQAKFIFSTNANK